MMPPLCGITKCVCQGQAFTAGIVLLLNIWGGKRSGLSMDPVKEMADVHKCMGALKALENRYVSCCGHRHLLTPVGGIRQGDSGS